MASCPADYGAAHWQLLAAALDAPRTPSDSEVMDFDTGLSAAFVTALRDLHGGRVDPATLGLSLPDRHADYDPAAAAQAVARGQIADAFAAAEPRLAQYHWIIAVLATYRELASDTTLYPVPFIRGTVHPGDPLPAANALRRWLAALGDMRPPPAPDTNRTYSDDLVAGVRHSRPGAVSIRTARSVRKRLRPYACR